MDYLDKLPYRINVAGNYYGLAIYKNAKSWTVHYFRITNLESPPIYESHDSDLQLAAFYTWQKYHQQQRECGNPCMGDLTEICDKCYNEFREWQKQQETLSSVK